MSAARAPARLWRRPDCNCVSSGCRCGDEVLHRKSTADHAGPVPEVVFDVLSSSGAALPAHVRNEMEPRFAQDFSGVRVHTDARAAESARAVSARAYTVGSHIVFGARGFQPGTEEGRSLLTHELAHVAQQGPRTWDRASLRISSPTDAGERAADQVATRVASGAGPTVAPGEGAAVLQRTWEAPRIGDCPARTPNVWLQKVVVDQEKAQSVTMHWSDGTVSASICSTGKGHCCVDGSVPDGTAGSVSESRRDGSNLTPITAGAGYPITDRYRVHNTWRFWSTFLSARGIGLHQHHTVTGTPLSHGCVRLPVETAQEIFCGARERMTRVEVRGFSRPDCEEPELQREWREDFRSAGAMPTDGERPNRARIILQNRREARRMLGESYGRQLSDEEIGQGTRGALAIPRCGYRAAEPTLEEGRAVPEVGAAANVPSTASEVLAPSGLERFVPVLSGALAGTRGLNGARREVRRIGRDLWDAATRAARGGRGDDRPLYWARLQMTRAIRQWDPQFRVSSPDRQSLIEDFDRASRGMESAVFRGPPGHKRIVISGFDPFGLETPEYGLTRATNPSGAAALALDGRPLRSGGVDAVVESVIFPVSYAAFDAGTVERFFGPYLGGSRPASMIMTISMGRRGDPFEVEEFAGRRRGAGFADNPGVTQTVRGEPPGIGRGPEFIRGTLPASARRSLGRAQPTPGELQVQEVPARSRRPVPGPSGPTVGSTSVEGSGGSFLSNEIFYRVGRLQTERKTTIPFGHLHVPFVSPDQHGFERTRDDIVRRVEAILTAVLPDI